jgi:hypothetical protein
MMHAPDSYCFVIRYTNVNQLLMCSAFDTILINSMHSTIMLNRTTWNCNRYVTEVLLSILVMSKIETIDNAARVVNERCKIRDHQ